MQTRRDQLQAYRFVTTRVQSALLHGEPDAAETPMRRIGVAMFSSIMIAVVAVVGFGIFGLIKPGTKDGYKDQGQLIVEKETGTRYVWDPVNGVLHPMLNYASAVLYLKAHPTVKSYSQKSLAGVPRGVPYGIANLPESLPAADKLVTGPWAVCSTPPAQENLGGPRLTVTVGDPVQTAQDISGDQALLVRVGDKQSLIWHDTQLSIKSPSVVSTAFGYSNVKPVQVSGGWLDTIRPGGELAPISVPGLGQDADYQVGGQTVRIGQVLQTGDSPVQYYVVTSNGLGPIEETDKSLLLSDSEVTQKVLGQKEPLQVAPADANSAKHADIASRTFLPKTPPQTVNPSAPGDPNVACASYTDHDATSTAVHVTLARQAPGQVSGGQALNSAVSIPPGTASLVRLLPQDNVESTSYYIVSDQGAKFGIPLSTQALGLDGQVGEVKGDQVIGWFGYDINAAVALPSSILKLIPDGTPLDAGQLNSAPAGTAVVPLPTSSG